MKTIYKILAPICGLAVFPAFFFLPLVRLSAKTLLSDGATGLLGLPEYISLFTLIKTASNADATTQTIMQVLKQLFTGDNAAFADALKTGLLITALVFFALMLICALTTAVFAVFSKKFIFGLCFPVGGIVCAMIGKAFFNGFTAPFMDGSVSLSKLLSDSGSALSGLLGSLVRIENFELAMAYPVCILLLGLACAFAILAMVERAYSSR